MAISMTDFAVEKIAAMIKRNNLDVDHTHLRIGLRAGGCSGYSYLFEFVDECEKHDKVLEFGTVKICIDKKSYLFLNGMEIDYEETPFKSGIKLNNPAATRTCGCGESIAF
jgi:iron-sulfur cluster assembly protein